MVQMVATLFYAAAGLLALAVLAQALLDYRDEIRLALTGRAAPAANVARVRVVGRPRRARSIRMRPASIQDGPAPLRAAA